MSEYVISGPVTGGEWRAGLAAERTEFRHMNAAGQLVDPTTETETQRTERIRALQDQRDARGYRDGPPSAQISAVLSEWLTDPENRRSAFARSLAEHPNRLPVGRVFQGDMSPMEARQMLTEMASELTSQRAPAGCLECGASRVTERHQC